MPNWQGGYGSSRRVVARLATLAIEDALVVEAAAQAAPALVVGAAGLAEVGGAALDDGGAAARVAHGGVRHGEARVQAHGAAHERAAVAAKKALALCEAAAGLVASAVALGGAVAEHGAAAERLARVGEHVEAAFEAHRRLVVIDEAGRSREEGVRDVVARRGSERARKMPPIMAKGRFMMIKAACRTELNEANNRVKIKPIVMGKITFSRAMARCIFSNEPPQTK